jgi:hypothetical protein
MRPACRAQAALKSLKKKEAKRERKAAKAAKKEDLVTEELARKIRVRLAARRKAKGVAVR